MAHPRRFRFAADLHAPGGPPILVGGGAPRLLRWAAATIDGIAALGGTDAPSLQRSPLALVGGAGAVAEVLQERRERWGYSSHVIPGDKAHDFAPTVAALTGT